MQKTIYIFYLGLYGRYINVWDWQKHERIQRIDVGSEGHLPMEIRFLHDPEATEGYVSATYSSNVFRIFRKPVSIHSGCPNIV